MSFQPSQFDRHCTILQNLGSLLLHIFEAHGYNGMKATVKKTLSRAEFDKKFVFTPVETIYGCCQRNEYAAYADQKLQVSEETFIQSNLDKALTSS